jgi:hypothetical protein
MCEMTRKITAFSTPLFLYIYVEKKLLMKIDKILLIWGLNNIEKKTKTIYYTFFNIFIINQPLISINVQNMCIQCMIHLRFQPFFVHRINI